MTKHKQTSTQRLFDALLEIAPIAIFEFKNGKPHIKRINEIACHTIGYSENELLTIDLYTLIEQETQNILTQRINHILSGEKVAENIEIKIKAKDGHDIYAALNLKPFYEKGKLKNILAVLYDLTQRKKAEENLQKSIQMTAQAKQELNIILDSSPIIIFYKDKEGKFKQVNKAFAKALNTTKENLIGKTVADLYSPKIAQDMRNDDLIVMKSKTPKLAIIEPYESPTGIGWIRTDKIPSYDENGTVNGIIGFSEDITERKKAQDALIESEQKYRMLIETASEGIILGKPDGPYTFVNNRFAQMLGYTIQEILGKSGTDFAFDEKYKQQIIQNRKTLHAGQCIFGERILRKKDGSILCTTYNASPMFDKEGKHIANMSLYTDITEHKKIENQLKEKERLAAIGATAAMVGHDIRNPLQAIMSDTYLLKQELTNMPLSKTKEGVSESLKGIEENINYINKIVADLQDYARPLNPNYTQIDLPETINSVIKSIPIPKNIKTTLQTKTDIKIRSDPTFLRRILTNLINNAIQAMPNGGKLNLSSHTKNNKIYITISDTGIGIPEEIKPKLFTPMVTTKAKGQGLGLAVAKRLTEALNGTITFSSQKGKGTKFIIQLPNK
jgi:PAS domain S-box-containing protein